MSGGLLGGLQYGMRCFAAAFILAMFAKMSPGEKALTNDLEKLSNGQGEAGTVYLDEYHQFDQCMVQPGYHDVYSHTIVFQLFPEQMNSGTGLLFCYQGQLDPFNHVSGRVMDPLFAVQNMPDNAIGNVCENARHELKSRCHLEDDPEKCELFVEYPWHGLKVIEDPNDPKNIIINMSTANESFIIARHEFSDKIDGRLYLKLANQFDVGSIVSRRIGPSSHLRESRIDISNDFARSYNFMEQMDKGGLFLQEQMGIFALGMDILLKDQSATELPFFIIRSACSEMSAAMLHPFEHAVSVLPKYKEKEKMPNKWVYPLLEDSVLSLRGQIEENADSFDIILSVARKWRDFSCGPDSSTDESKVASIFLKYDFKNNKTTLETTVFYTDGPMVYPRKIVNKGTVLHKGQHFLMKATVLNDGFNISLNCGPMENFTIYEKLPFNRPLNFKIVGATIYEMSIQKPDKANIALLKSAKLQDYWNVTAGNDSRPLGTGRGLLFRGNLTADWKVFKLYFINNKEMLLFTFDAKNGEEKAVLKWFANNTNFCDSEEITENDGKLMGNVQCNCFELYFKFEEKVIKTFLNGKWIFNNSEIASVLEVAHIKVDADISGPLELNQTTWTVPEEGRLFDLKGRFDSGYKLTISGKFFDEAEKMQISLISTNDEINGLPQKECWENLANDSCLDVMQINIDLMQNTISLNSQFMKRNTKLWDKEILQTIDMALFVPGKTFELTIRAVDEGNKVFTFTFDKIPLGNNTFERDTKNSAEFIWINLDHGVLFNEPRVEKS